MTATARAELVVVGVSRGGLDALRCILAGLPGSLPAAVAIVQHRRAGARNVLLDLLRRCASSVVMEPDHGDPIRPGRIYLAPADYHLLIEPGWFALSTEAPINCARPSIDVLFETAAAAYGERVLAVQLTGASADGARGAVMVKRGGGAVIVQDPRTAESPIGPRAVLDSVAVDGIVDLAHMARHIAARCAGRREQADRANHDHAGADPR